MSSDHIVGYSSNYKELGSSCTAHTKNTEACQRYCITRLPSDSALLLLLKIAVDLRSFHCDRKTHWHRISLIHTAFAVRHVGFYRSSHFDLFWIAFCTSPSNSAQIAHPKLLLSSIVARVSAIYIYTNLRFGHHKISYFKHHKLQFETASERAITDKV